MSETLERLSAALRDRYAVDRQAGEGGMATVFLAQDLKHRRAVAIKVMRPELAASVGTDRFLREIELAARLQHPHIVPVYDSGSATEPGMPGPILYYVMPFIEGESLRDRLQRERQLPVEESVRIVREAASALAYAHAHDIVHRDIKPENILISGGHAVVADFGIARALNAAAGATGATSSTGTALTGLGLAIGTPAYMSPEQATASSDVDGRSDQYSLACVLYEMLAGEPAFAGTTVQSILTKSITGPRPRVRVVRKAVPAPLDEVITKAMAKEPGERYASMGEFADALGRAAAGVGGSSARPRGALLAGVAAAAALVLGFGGWWAYGRSASPVVEEAQRIAVLPFSVTGSDIEVMGEGMVDLMSTNLGGVGGIQTVEPRTVLARWKQRGGGEVDLEGALALARDVDAGSVLLGSVVALGPTVRLSAELHSQAGASLGKATVDGPADSVLVLVDRLSLALMRSVWQSNEPIPSLRVSGLTTTSIEAMRAYLQGEQFYRRSEYDSAVVAFGRAIEADSTFAMAHFRLAISYGWIGNYGGQEARTASEAAVRYSGRLPERERTLVAAYQLFQEGRPEAADSMRRYLTVHPNDVDGWYLLGESQHHARQLNGLDPTALQAPFDRVLALDSSLTPAAIHPLELTLAYRDSARFARYMRVFDVADAEREADIFRTGGRIVWDPTANVDSLYTVLASGSQMGATYSTVVSVLQSPAATSDSLLTRLEQLVRGVLAARPNERFIGSLPAMARAGLGQVKESKRIADSLMPTNQDAAFGISLMPAWLGIATPEDLAALDALFAKAPATNPWVLLLRSQVALAGHDPEAAAVPLKAGLALDTTTMQPGVRGLLIAADGWRLLESGDTTGALRQMEAGLRQARGLIGSKQAAAVRYRWAQVLAARPATREEGIRRLRFGFEQDPDFIPIVTFTLAKTYEAAGRRDEAAAAYGKFLRLWDKADPALQSYVTDARQSLQELTAE